jgi:two-component system, cell cycle sensor histidine kinase and response regulator CckA
MASGQGFRLGRARDDREGIIGPRSGAEGGRSDAIDARKYLMSGRITNPGVAQNEPGVCLTAENHVHGIAGYSSAGYFQKLFESAPDALIVLDENGRFVDANPAGCRLIGLSENELIGRSVKDTIETAADFEAVWSKFTKEETYCGQRWMVRPDGSRRLIEIRATANVLPGRHFAIWRDVTGRYFLESELIRREREQAVVRLAEVLAHDLTNLLNVIAGHAELMALGIAADSQLQNHIDRIRISTKQASALNAQLSALGRQQVLSPAVVDLSAFLIEQRAILQRLVPEDVDLVLPQDAAGAEIRIDRTQLTQVLISLVSTAGETFSNGGRLTVRVSTVHLQSDLTKPGLRVPSGVYAVLELRISNMGPGADGKKHSSADSSVAPFGSTGASLPAISATIAQNNAFLWIAGTADGGTLSVYFPQTAGNDSVILQKRQSEKVGGSETILLVDDDPMLREATREYLKSLGYRVLRAGDGEEALQTAQSAGHIDALVADLKMPRMGGRELAEKLTAARPGIKVMFVSGNLDRELIFQKAEVGGPALLPKPFALRGLAKMLRDLLDDKATAAANT